MSQDGRELGKVRRFRNTRLGVRALLDDLQPLSEPALIGLEATGHDWLARYDELVRAGHTVQVLHPRQTHAYRKTTGRTVKKRSEGRLADRRRGTHWAGTRGLRAR